MLPKETSCDPNVGACDKLRILNLAAAGLNLPKVTLFMAPVTVGLKTTFPDPVGLMVTVPLAGDSVDVCVTDSVDAVIADDLIEPISTLSNVPLVIVELIELVTVNADTPVTVSVTVLVVGSNTNFIKPSVLPRVNVSKINLEANVGCPDTTILLMLPIAIDPTSFTCKN